MAAEVRFQSFKNKMHEMRPSLDYYHYHIIANVTQQWALILNLPAQDIRRGWTHLLSQGIMRVSPAAVSENTKSSSRIWGIVAVSSLQPSPE